MNNTFIKTKKKEGFILEELYVIQEWVRKKYTKFQC